MLFFSTGKTDRKEDYPGRLNGLHHASTC